MRTIETTLYTYDELSDAAKKKARREWLSLDQDSSNFDYTTEDFAEVLKLIGVDVKEREATTYGGKTFYKPCIYWSGFYSQGDGASYEGTYTYSPEAVNAIRSYAPQDEALCGIAEELEKLGKANREKVYASIVTSGRYSHSGTMSIDATTENDDWEEDYLSPEDEESLETALRDLADWFYKRLQDENDYQTSDDAVAETLEANGYEFTEDGERA